MFRNTGDRGFREVGAEAGVAGDGDRWSTSRAFLDYDRDGDLDLFVSRYLHSDPARVPRPGESELCRCEGVHVVCGPRGLPPETPSLYRNDGTGRFDDVSGKSGVGTVAPHCGFSALTGDFDGDGWPDIYFAADSSPSVLLRNLGNGAFEESGYESGTAVNEHGNEQGRMRAAAGDFNPDGLVNIAKTNFDFDIASFFVNLGNGLFSEDAMRSR